MQKVISIFLAVFSISIARAETLPLNDIKLPPHFKISLYATVPDARSMTLGDNGIVYVGNRGGGSVYALIPEHNFSKAKEVITIAKNLNMPNGIAYDHGSLYVAEVDRVLKFPDIEKQLKDPKFEVIYDKLPTSPHHGWRYIGIGPDHKLYIAIGAPCNVCEQPLPFATITRMDLDGKNFEVYVKGIRNSVGFDWDPTTKYLWFTMNERDWLGDDIPPDGIGIADRAGLNFGFPYFWGDRHWDSAYTKPGLTPRSITVPALFLPAHCAPLGMRFYTGKMFPEKYFHQVFVAEHGSWNRLKKVGYQIILVTIKNHKPVAQSVFAMGWLQGEKAWGRPVDLLVMPDGSMLVSDDYAGVVYRIAYEK